MILIPENEAERVVAERLNLDLLLYGQLHVTNARGITRLDPRGITYAPTGDELSAYRETRDYGRPLMENPRPRRHPPAGHRPSRPMSPRTRPIRRVTGPRHRRSVVHAAPVGAIGETVTPCCGREPMTELPRTDRLTLDPALVTCRAPDTDRAGGRG